MTAPPLFCRCITEKEVSKVPIFIVFLYRLRLSKGGGIGGDVLEKINLL